MSPFVKALERLLPAGDGHIVEAAMLAVAQAADPTVKAAAYAITLGHPTYLIEAAGRWMNIKEWSDSMKARQAPYASVSYPQIKPADVCDWHHSPDAQAHRLMTVR